MKGTRGKEISQLMCCDIVNEAYEGFIGGQIRKCQLGMYQSRNNTERTWPRYFDGHR